MLLKPDTYASVHFLFEGMTYHLAVVTVLAGILPGRIYVNNPANPRTAILIPSNRHRIYMSGEPDPRLLANVIHILSEESLEKSYGFVMYYKSSHRWQPALEQVLQKQEIDATPLPREPQKLAGIVGPITRHLSPRP